MKAMASLRKASTLILVWGSVFILTTIIPNAEGYRCFRCHPSNNDQECDDDFQPQLTDCSGRSCFMKFVNESGTETVSRWCNWNRITSKSVCSKTICTDVDREETFCTCLEHDCNGKTYEEAEEEFGIKVTKRACGYQRKTYHFG